MKDNIEIQPHVLPALIMLEAKLPDSMVDNLNEYLDKLLKKKKFILFQVKNELLEWHF